MSNKVILFDWNGLIDKNIIVNRQMVEYWRTILDLDYDTISNDEMVNILLRMYSKGHVLNTMDMWIYNESVDHVKQILSEFKITSNFERITTTTKNLYSLATIRPFNHEVVSKLMSLKNKCKVGILANCNQFDLIALDSSLDRSDLDFNFISCLMHRRMSSVRFYFKVQERLCRPLKDVMFITSDLKHGEKAEHIGWDVKILEQDVDISILDGIIDEFLED